MDTAVDTGLVQISSCRLTVI